jgi:Xaa-Pro dipeptidase
VQHLDRIRERMKRQGIDCVIVTEKSNFIYSIGEEAVGYLFIMNDDLKLVLPRFYLYDLENYDANYYFTAEERKEKLSEVSQYVDGKVITDKDQPGILGEIFNAEHSDMIQDLRKVKMDREVKNIKEACRITDNALENLRTSLFEGKTEIEAQLELKKFYSNQKVTESFLTNKTESLVQRNCLKPHRSPKDKLIKKQDLVIVDTGARKNFYCADVTRTYCAKPSEKQQELFESVKKIQNESIEMISPGVKIKNIKERQIEMMEELGYNPDKNMLYFGHSIGIEAHESPSISLSTDEKFKEGMTVTVEPGIHKPDLGGVRIEDTVLVTENGSERLSTAQRKL